ncbi:AMP-binding protein [Streptomyces sp. NPDC048002]|uniref:class I adenylate-forming enzyme family protein n=1 Tax=Streptomyces sp. NPDC048002 TaxID=3154344 RepID=UPI0033F37F4F
MSSYLRMPWLDQYHDGQHAGLEPEYHTMLDAFRAAADRAPDQAAVRYFDGVLTLAQVDRASDALAVALLEGGFHRHDRLALYVQNNPGFVIGVIAAWKAGGTAVPVNPMNKASELRHLLDDCGATALLCLDTLYLSVVQGVISTDCQAITTVITTSACDWQTRDDDRVMDVPPIPAPPGTLSLLDIVAAHNGRTPGASPPQPDDIAALTYTSGTTGRPKGAMNTHRAMVHSCCNFRQWMSLTPADTVLGTAPLFHITGLLGHLGLALLLPCPLVLTHRFHPAVTLEALREHRPTFTVAAITALTRLLEESQEPAADFASLRVIYSGGAPIAPAVGEAFHARTGIYLHNIYGLTETTSITHATPLGARSPVDPASGTLSIGVPVFGTSVRILDDSGQEVPVGETGEIAISGPQIIPGYWGHPEATAEALPGGELRTGDVGFMDKDGWFYLVDRKKDMINAAGYKVWPREVEDLLQRHPAIREAAVVGVPDRYRGETVVAFVSLHAGSTVTPAELVRFGKDNMAAYKYPRTVHVLDELPKTPSGKILRRELRDRTSAPSDPD